MSNPTRRHGPGGIIAAVASVALAVGCSAPHRPSTAPAPAPLAVTAKEVLPRDLDAVIWLDIDRLRGLWSLKPNRQIAAILAEYGLVVTANDGEAAFWLKLLEQSERWWIGCRPTRDGCRDSVLFARGHYDRQDPALGLPDLKQPLDLGAGWLRYDRKGAVGRQQVARLYAAPPDRTVVVGPAELDAVERRLESGHADDPLLVEERGLFSMTLRAVALARLFEQRAPAAARLLREATVIRLWLEADAQALKLTTTMAFPDRERAELAREAFAVVASALGARQGQSGADPQAEVVGSELVLQLQFRQPPALPVPTSKDTDAAGATEPATQ